MSKNKVKKVVMLFPTQDGLHILLVSNGTKNYRKGEVIRILKSYPAEEILNETAVYEDSFIKDVAEMYKNNYSVLPDVDPMIDVPLPVLKGFVKNTNPAFTDAMIELFSSEVA